MDISNPYITYADVLHWHIVPGHYALYCFVPYFLDPDDRHNFAPGHFRNGPFNLDILHPNVAHTFVSHLDISDQEVSDLDVSHLGISVPDAKIYPFILHRHISDPDVLNPYRRYADNIVHFAISDLDISSAECYSVLCPFSENLRKSGSQFAALK